MQNKTDKGTLLVSKSLPVANSNSVSRLFSARNKKCYVSRGVYVIPVQYRIYPLKWSWRESNPRPNKEHPCFLHAYSVVDCRAKQGNRHPKLDLIS